MFIILLHISINDYLFTVSSHLLSVHKTSIHYKKKKVYRNLKNKQNGSKSKQITENSSVSTGWLIELKAINKSSNWVVIISTVYTHGWYKNLTN